MVVLTNLHNVCIIASMRIQSVPTRPKEPKLNRRSFLLGAVGAVAIVATGVIATRDKVVKVSSIPTTPEAPEIDFTGEAIDIKPNINWPQGVNSNDVYAQIAQFVEAEVLKFRKDDAEGRMQGEKADVIRSFVGWLNEQIATSTGVAPEVASLISAENQQYFSQHTSDFHENWEYRLNTYLVPAGYFLVTRPNEGVVQIFKIDQKQSQYVDVKMGKDTYRTPMLQVDLISPNHSDPEVVGFLHDTNVDGQSIAVLVRSGLKIREANERTLVAFKMRAQRDGGADLGRFEAEMQGADVDDAIKSIAQHELSHTVIERRFSNISHSNQKRQFVVRWFGTRTNEQRYAVLPIEADEMFAEGAQISSTDNPWRHLVTLFLNDFYKSPRGKILFLQALMAAPDSAQKQAVVKKLESSDFNQAISDAVVVNSILEIVMSSDYKDSHAKKAGELYMQLGYSYFQ